MIRDRDSIFSTKVDEQLKAFGLRVLRTPARAPQANAYCERLVGTVRRECLDFMIPFGEAHLQRILKEWIAHYNQGRPHFSLGPGIPEPAFVIRRPHGCGVISRKILGVGLQVPFVCSEPSDAIAVEVASLAATPRNSSSSPKCVERDIRSVDFRNFEYRPDCLDKKSIRVTNGEWKEVGVKEEDFRVVSVTYGDLEGNGQEQAVILGACAGIANFEIGEVLVFSASANGLTLIAQLSPADWGKGEEDNGSDFQVTDVGVGRQGLAVNYLAGGSHACSAWIVTAKYRFSGHNLIRVGSDRRANPCNEQP